jgi:hypothetical protein
LDARADAGTLRICARENGTGFAIFFAAESTALPRDEHQHVLAAGGALRTGGDVPRYLFRLWVHDAGDGLLPEITIRAEAKMPAAALALHHFVSLGRPISSDSYLESEPRDGMCLRVHDVLAWLQSPEGQTFAGGRCALGRLLSRSNP